MKISEVWSLFTRKHSGQSAAGTVIAVFVAILIGTVLISPIQTSVNTAKIAGGSTFNTSSAINSTVDNLPLLFTVLLLIVAVGGMLSVIQ